MARMDVVFQTALLFLLGLKSIHGAKWINSFAGPYIVTTSKWYPCPPEKSEHLIDMDFKISQFRSPTMIYKNLQKYTGNASLRIPMANTGYCYMKAASRSQNQWKENALVFKFPNGPCRAVMDFWPDFSRKVYKVDPDDHRTGPCIIREGFYTAKDVPINWTFPKISVLPYAQWKVEIGMDIGTERKPKNVMCSFVEAVTHPQI